MKTEIATRAEAAETHAETQPANRYLTKVQVADIFQVTPKTIESWMKRKLLPWFCIGGTIRFDATTVHTYVTEHYLCRRGRPLPAQSKKGRAAA